MGEVFPVLKLLSTAPWRRMGQWTCRSTFFLTSALAGGEWSASPPVKELPVPIGQDVGWIPEPVGTTWRRENSWPYRDSNSDPSLVQPVASRYNDYAIPDHSRGYNAWW
jgi:hypothetical protein